MSGYIERRIALSRNLRLARARPTATQDPLSAEVAWRHAQTMNAVNLPAGRVLDLGCGSAVMPDSISRSEQVVRLDWVCWPQRPDVQADVVRLPFADASFGMVWSNLCLPWIDQLPEVFAETRRVLGDGGLFSATSLGPDTLIELRQLGVSATPRTLGFLDMHDLTDILGQQGFAEPVAVRETINFRYTNAAHMLAELRTFGVLAATGMATHIGHKQFVHNMQQRTGPLSVTFEVIYVHSWAMSKRKPKGPTGWEQMRFTR